MARQLTRRQMLGSLVALVPVPLLAQPRQVEESDPQARALGYTHDASKVEKAKFKSYQPGQTCASCNFFRGTANEAPCDIFGGKLVNAKGWCSVWAKKA